jgi:diadenosine tetraphosphate (Ap4A) HIT family hydrolase
MGDDFVLDPRLGETSTPVAELPLSDLRLSEDARFPWLILVPRRPDIAELIDLPDLDRATLFDEIVIVSKALKAATECDKLNVAALGNQVRQLHVHIIARFTGDPAWPKPVWGAGAAVAWKAAERDRLIARIRKALPA